MKFFKIICWTECPFCIKAKNMLINSDIPFEYSSVDHSQELLNHYKTIYSHKTVPMIVLKEDGVDDKFIGGYTELVKFLESRDS